MSRFNAILLTGVVACAIGVITSQHQARKLFNELDTEQARAKKLDEEYTQLTLEQSTWATHKRVEGVAARQLGMALPQPGNTVVVTSTLSPGPSPKGEGRPAPTLTSGPSPKGEGR